MVIMATTITKCVCATLMCVAKFCKYSQFFYLVQTEVFDNLFVYFTNTMEVSKKKTKLRSEIKSSVF